MVSDTGSFGVDAIQESEVGTVTFSGALSLAGERMSEGSDR
jgi:hypothetical protein